MDTIARWFAMGGYGAFVWPAYAVAITVLGGITFCSWRHHRRSIAELDRLQRLAGRTE